MTHERGRWIFDPESNAIVAVPRPPEAWPEPHPEPHPEPDAPRLYTGLYL